jgi:hypothetical protein
MRSGRACEPSKRAGVQLRLLQVQRTPVPVVVMLLMMVV